MRNFVLLYISIIGLSVSNSTTWASELNAETEAIMKAVIQAHEAEVDRLRQARGSATISILGRNIDGTEIKENPQIEFYFKGQSRRSDIYSRSSETFDKSFLRSRVDNGEFYYRYNPVLNSASVDRSGSAAFKGDLAEDFHHDVFFNWISNIPLRRTLQRIIDKKYGSDFDYKVEFIDDNLLKLSGSSNEKKKYGDRIMDKTEAFTFVLDPRHSYRIVKYHYEQKNVNGPGSSNVDDLSVDWQGQPLGEQYPRYVKYDHSSVLSETTKPPEGVKELNREIERHIEINVEEFEPGIDIDDTVFTLKGMGVRNDTNIDDIISGVFYTYGSMKVSEAFLESLLNDSKIPEHSSVTTAANKNPSSKEDTQDIRSVIAKGKTDSGWNIKTIAILFAVIIVGAFFLLRLIACKRKPN